MPPVFVDFSFEAEPCIDERELALKTKFSVINRCALKTSDTSVIIHCKRLGFYRHFPQSWNTSVHCQTPRPHLLDGSDWVRMVPYVLPAINRFWSPFTADGGHSTCLGCHGVLCETIRLLPAGLSSEMSRAKHDSFLNGKVVPWIFVIIW